MIASFFFSFQNSSQMFLSLVIKVLKYIVIASLSFFEAKQLFMENFATMGGNSFSMFQSICPKLAYIKLAK